MQTHRDSQYIEEFLERLYRRATSAKVNKTSQITTGTPDEEPLAIWKANGVYCQHLPDDEQGIARISIGGGDGLPVSVDYCNIRGGVGRCIELMERAITALKESP